MGEEPLLGRRGEEGEGRRPHNIAANVPTEVVLISYEMLASLLDLEPDVADTLLRLIAVCSTQNPHLALAAADAAGGGGGGGGGKKAAAVKQAQGATAAFAASFAERCSP